MLLRLANEIDVPQTKYQEAKERYTAVGEWLGAEGSSLEPFRVTVFPQGSFALGTAVKPTEGCEYDVDAVCLLHKPPTSWSQQRLKQEVGDRLRAHGTYKKMLRPPEGGRRCWTLQYADGSQFHLDVLPAKPDDYAWLVRLGVPQKFAETAIQITCKDCYGDAVWPKSNPVGYLQWFVERMQVRFDEARRRTALAKRAEVHEVPEYEVQTPLQRVVQILKRQRDNMFGDDPDKPISIIITTLSARAYRNEDDLTAAYQNIVRGMRSQIQQVNGKYVILNPVNPSENFADRWITHPERQEQFFSWLDEVEETERELSGASGFEKRAELLTESFGPSGARAASAAAASLVKAAHPINEAVALSMSLPQVLEAPHRLPPPWPLALGYTATVSARASQPGFRTVNFSDRSPSPPLAKGVGIWFTLKTDVPDPFDVYWQVVNTGDEATRERGLRGGFDPGGVKRYESTSYRGRHMIQAHIVKGGQCVAQSKAVFVLIK
jgi:hypothetical protein